MNVADSKKKKQTRANLHMQIRRQTLTLTLNLTLTLTFTRRTHHLQSGLVPNNRINHLNSLHFTISWASSVNRVNSF